MRANKKLHFSTGEFAKLCRTTKDTLFHYDRIGLFKPDFVGENGYRGYSMNQYFLFTIIWILKEAGSSLSDIKKYVGNQEADQLLTLLIDNKQRLEKDRQRITHMLFQLDGVIRATKEGLAIKEMLVEKETGKENGKGAGSTEPRIELCEEEWLVATPFPEEPEKQDEACFILAEEEHLRYCSEGGLGDPLAIGCIKKKETLYAGNWREDYYYSSISGDCQKESRESERFHLRPAGTYAVLEHCGFYDTLEQSCQKLLAYMKERGYTAAGCAYESDLLNFMSTSDPEDYVIRISIKVNEIPG